MSKNLKRFIDDLQGDWELIGAFFDNPESVLDQYDLSSSEKASILSRNLNDLNGLGINEQLAVGALSGAHSKRCSSGSV
ncbi:hypothetical protein [Staphylococcus americanisciuri]|uniref:Uncharacterized protein n=1 Tax=Staphylococcus americanisciuri TaxID=2973940 RepID=A0ABT2F044_9STAP|nr:hypothetical protein [Staphylococcus americanisciuri]MCS4485759.1 hypothetical protein [Staphylococcus americanisciuri]